MKLPYIVSIISVLIALIVTILFYYGIGEKDMFLVILGIICLLESGVELLIAGILYLAGNKPWGKAFLLSAGILLLIGVGVCGPLLLSM